jgi:hypothetical protein
LLWPYSVYSGALLWQRYVVAIRDAAQRLAAGSFLEIRYEDLCADPEKIVKQIANSSANALISAC